MASFSSVRNEVLDREERRRHYASHLLGLNAYERHKKFMNDYALHYRPSVLEREVKPLKTDHDTLRETYRFIRTEEDDVEASWEQRLAKRYYDKLFREYCIADMAQYKDGKIGLRWRSEKEVISGKGQFICGNKKCDAKEDLSSYEVNFAYIEAGQSKQALVKLRVCPKCADKLNYQRNKLRAKSSLCQERDDIDVKRSEEQGSTPNKRKRKMDDQQKKTSEHREQSGGNERPEVPLQGTDEDCDKYFKGMFL